MDITKMKEQLLKLVQGMKKDGHNFKEAPPLFQWQYEEEPNILFELLVTEAEPDIDMTEAPPTIQ